MRSCSAPSGLSHKNNPYTQGVALRCNLLGLQPDEDGWREPFQQQIASKAEVYIQ